MKRRLYSLFLCAILLLSMTWPVFGAFEDIEGHWGQSYIERATSLGLFAGVSETAFAPNDPMTRGMFVTVLGRLAGIEPEEWNVNYLAQLFADVPAKEYYAPYISWAVHRGITSGTGPRQFSPNDNVTREQMATFLANFLRIEGYVLPAGDETVTFSDQASISAWAQDGVSFLTGAGLFTGKPDGKGGLYFDPRANATRAECATLFCRMIDAVEKPEVALVEPTGISLSVSNLTMEIGDFNMLLPSIEPITATNQTVIWYSSNPKVASVDLMGSITALAGGTTQITAVTSNRLRASCTVTVNNPKPPVATGLSYHEKCMLIFGEDVSEPRTYYSSASEAEPNMVSVSVRTWDINKAGEKYTRTWSVKVHKNIAPTVQAVFEEIYALPEQFPIHSLGGYRWEYKSEHGVGLALDVNWDENYYCDPNGNAITGSYFKPGEDPYSIPVGGAVDQIFARYGFTRGIYWRSGYKDYMHYSFFGT